MADRVVLAVDGGNTKTVAALADRRGNILRTARAGRSDIHAPGGVDAGLAVLVDVVVDVLGGRTVADLDAAVFSVAGADWPEDFGLLRAELVRRLGLPLPPIVVNDAIGALRAGAPDWEGVSVMCGTFNAVGARHRDGAVFHLGFWPDRTGGFDLANDAVRAVYRHGLGLGPPTALSAAVLERFECDDALALMHAVTRRDGPVRAELPSVVTPVLFDVAEAGDAVARRIVVQSGTWLGEQARVSAGRVGLALEGTLIVVGGGVLQHRSTLLVDAVMARVPGAVAVRHGHPPVVGALLVALDTIRAPGDASALASSLGPVDGPISTNFGH